MKLNTFYLIILVFLSCQNGNITSSKENNSTNIKLDIKTDDYELLRSEKSKAVLILFGGYSEKPSDIKREFKIVKLAKKNNIDLLLMNYNRRLWLEENEKALLQKRIESIFDKNKLPKDNIYIGGFSSGGNVSMLISNYFLSQKKNQIRPKGVFIVDSPVDLLELYHCAEKNVERNFLEMSVRGSKFQIEILERQCGNPNNDISQFEKYSIYTMKSHNITNTKYLKDCKIRFYTEPDTVWWMENRRNDYEDMNAYVIKHLAEALQKEFGEKQIEYIPTKNKGYRSNGIRHPHSWSIVDVDELVEWILEK